MADERAASDDDDESSDGGGQERDDECALARRRPPPMTAKKKIGRRPSVDEGARSGGPSFPPPSSNQEPCAFDFSAICWPCRRTPSMRPRCTTAKTTAAARTGSFCCGKARQGSGSSRWERGDNNSAVVGPGKMKKMTKKRARLYSNKNGTTSSVDGNETSTVIVSIRLHTVFSVIYSPTAITHSFFISLHSCVLKNVDLGLNRFALGRPDRGVVVRAQMLLQMRLDKSWRRTTTTATREPTTTGTPPLVADRHGATSPGRRERSWPWGAKHGPPWRPRRRRSVGAARTQTCFTLQQDLCHNHLLLFGSI